MSEELKQQYEKDLETIQQELAHLQNTLQNLEAQTKQVVANIQQRQGTGQYILNKIKELGGNEEGQPTTNKPVRERRAAPKGDK